MEEDMQPGEGRVDQPTRPRQQQPIDEGRVEGLARKGLRWAVALGLSFVLGIASLWIVRLRPQEDRIRLLESDEHQAQVRIDELELEVTELESLRQENQDLRQQLGQSELHLDLLGILVDVESAQIALEQEDASGAQSALRETDEKLQQLGTGMGGSPAEAVQAMRDRLRLVMEELDSDGFAARQDLEIMANNLLSLEEVLFGSG